MTAGRTGRNWDRRLVTRVGFAAWLGLGLVLLLLGVPEVSMAATADLQVTPYEPNDSFLKLATFNYGAAPGEANDLVVDISQKGGLLTITATDGGAAISPGTRCAATAVNSVTCSYQATSPSTFLYVPTSTVIRLGDGDDSALFPTPTFGGVLGVEDALNVDYRIDSGMGDDRVTVAGQEPLVSFSSLRGGRGNDVLRGPGLLDGGGGRDELHGALGSALKDGDTEGSVDADILDAGGGGQVNYGSRTRPLHIDLQEAAGQGERGEGDRITGVTRVIGGRANDFIGGTALNDELGGGLGNDRIDGRGGNDLISVNGRDRAFGGPGDDVFAQNEGQASFEPMIVCGPGNDSSGGALNGRGPWFSRTCESVTDDLGEDSVLFAPTQPVAASSTGRLVFRLSHTCEPARYRFILASGRAPITRLATRRFRTRAGRCNSPRRLALILPERVASLARRRPVRLRERVNVDIPGVERRSLVWRFDLRLPRR